MMRLSHSLLIFALRRVLRALLATVVVVLLAGLVLVVGEYVADERLQAAEREACRRASDYRFEDVDFLPCPPYPWPLPPPVGVQTFPTPFIPVWLPPEGQQIQHGYQATQVD